MATNSSTSMKKGNTNLPPKRGQIKIQIFESFKETLVSTASKAGEALGIRSSKGGDSGGSSASTSPPPSGYNSDWNSNLEIIKLSSLLPQFTELSFF